MGMLECAEAVFKVLAGEYNTDFRHECFAEMFNGCCSLAAGRTAAVEPIEVITKAKGARDELRICLDICSYFRAHGQKEKPSEILARAVAAGKAAMEGKD